MVATMSPNEAGKAAGTGGSATRNAGEGGMTGSAGASNTGGVAGTAGSPTAGVESSGGSSGGHAPSTGHCEPIGWATRAGRTGGEVKVTGGGDATPVVVSSFDKLQSLAQDAAPRVIHIDGNAGSVGSGWNGTSGDRLEVGSNKTIIGLHPGTQLKAAMHVKDASNVIIRNLVIRGPGSNSDQAWDNLNIEGSSKNIWIDHCEFWDGQDGNADVVKGADNVTFTWNIFGYRNNGGHNFSNLVASSDDESESEGKLNITLMFNWFTGVAQRQPRCRYGDIHVVNNLFSKDGLTSDYGISAGKDCKIVTEANHFIEINSPIYMSHASGSAGNELRGDNLFEKTSGSMTGYGTAFDPPYKYQHVLVKAAEVKAKLDKRVGATLQSPNECDW
jgi:pectate lyase